MPSGQGTQDKAHRQPQPLLGPLGGLIEVATRDFADDKNIDIVACPGPLVVTRRVSVRGSVMVGGQKIQAGLAHARKTVQVTVGTDTCQITVEPGIIVTAARTSSRDIKRHKASNYD
jgi:hypothetical protein